MDQERGKLIVFEGPDGVGKTTVAERIVQELKSRGRPVMYLSFPGRVEGTLGELVYRVHHSPTMLEVHPTPTALQALHIAAHIDTIERVIRPALASGITIVLDRYWWSTRVYGAISGADENVIEELIAAEQTCWGTEGPNMIFLLKTKRPRRRITMPLKQWRALWREYRVVCESSTGEVLQVNNNRPLDKVASVVIGRIEKLYS